MDMKTGITATRKAVRSGYALRIFRLLGSDHGIIYKKISPQSVAVVGASNRPGSVGLATFKNLLRAGYKGVLYPVHPKARSVQGVKAYPSLAEIPDQPDLTVIIVGAGQVPGIVGEAARRESKGCLIISAGFKEIGGHGAVLEDQLKGLVRETGIRIIGPNCL